jgi:hypothetical protein
MSCRPSRQRQLTNKKRKQTQQTVLCQLIQGTDRSKHHLFSRLCPHVTACRLASKPPGERERERKQWPQIYRRLNIRPNSRDTLRFAFEDVNLPASREVWGHPEALLVGFPPRQCVTPPSGGTGIGRQGRVSDISSRMAQLSLLLGKLTVA